MSGLKLTKINNASYYRDDKSGNLIGVNREEIREIVIERLNKKSPKLTKGKPYVKEVELLEKFVSCLKGKEEFTNGEEFRLLNLSSDKLEKYISRNGKKQNIIQYISRFFKGEAIESLKDEFLNLENTHKNKISKKIEKSIINNKIGYKYNEELKVTSTTRRGKIYSELLSAISSKEDLYKKVEPYVAVILEGCNFSSVINIDNDQDKKILFEISDTLRKQKSEIFNRFKEKKEENYSEFEMNLFVMELITQYVKRVKENSQDKSKKMDIKKVKDYLEENKIKRNITGLLHNRLTNNAIEGGKLIHYKIKGEKDNEYKNISSKDLEAIKIEEVYNKKYTSSFSLVWSSFNKVLQEVTIENLPIGDLIGTKNLKKLDIDTNKGSRVLIEKFGVIPTNENLFEYFSDIHQILSKIRHSRIHFQIEQDKEEEIINKQYFIDSLNRYIVDFKGELLEKFKSNGIFHGYTVGNIEKILMKLKFDFETDSKLYPSFDKVLKRLLGRTKPYENKSINFLLKKLSNYDLSIDFEAREKLSKKFLLQQLYKNAFQKVEIKNNFFEYVEEFKRLNAIERNKNIGYTPVYEILTEDFEEYFKELQRLMIIEQTKEECAESKEFSDPREDYIQRYREDLFGFIFYKFLEKNIDIINIINNYSLDIKITNRELDEKKEILFKRDLEREIIKFKFIENNQINFDLIESFVYYSFLDSKNLSELNQEICKYIQSIDKNKIKDISEYKNKSKLIQLMLAVKDRYSKGENSGEISSSSHEIFSLVFSQDIYDVEKKEFKPEYEELFLENQLYIQGKREKKEWILYHNLEKLKEYSLTKYIEKILKESENHYRITGDDIKEYIELKQVYNLSIGNRDTYISTQKLHEELLPYKTKRLNEKEIIVKIKEYKKHIEKKYRFEHLKNKLEFVDLKRMTEVSNEIIARTLSYTQKFERDAYFVKLYIESLKGTEKEKIEKIFNDQYIEREGNQLKKFLKEDKVKFLMHIEGDSKKVELRNKLAHFDLLKETDTKFINIINELKNLMAYDKKILNTIPFVIKEILLQKIGIKIEFKYKQPIPNTNLELKNISSEQDNHLKFNTKDGFKINKNSKEFENLIRLLLQ